MPLAFLLVGADQQRAAAERAPLFREVGRLLQLLLLLWAFCFSGLPQAVQVRPPTPGVYHAYHAFASSDARAAA